MAIIKEELRLTDLIEVSTLQKMQDAFAAMTGVAVITTDSNGVAVTEPSDFSDFCINYVRSTEAGMECCEKCDKMGAEMARNAGDSCAYFDPNEHQAVHLLQMCRELRSSSAMLHD